MPGPLFLSRPQDLIIVEMYKSGIMRIEEPRSGKLRSLTVDKDRLEITLIDSNGTKMTVEFWHEVIE